MASVVDIFGRAFTPPEPKKPETPERQLITAIADAGMVPPDRVVIDGHLHRWSASGKPKDDTGWYVAFPGVVTAGQFGDWRTGISVPWRADIGRELSQAEQMALARHAAEARRLRDIEQAKKRESAADTADVIWEASTPASDHHPYLTRKRISANGLRVTGDGRLVCPMYADGELVSLQFIDATGDKRFLSGGKTAGAVYMLGSADGASTVYACEGVATAATIFEATGQPVVVSYSAGNLTAAAQFAAHLCKSVVVVADNDESGTGQREGRKAADAIGARLVVPPTEGQDANDYAQAGGDLCALLAPPQPTGWLVSADDFAREPAPIRWLVKGWLPREGMAMVHGPSGGGKTFVVLDWCCRIAAGLSDWCGHKVKPGAVVYLAGEGHHGLKGRIAAWKKSHSAEHLSLWISQAGIDLNSPEGYRYATEAINALPEPPALIVVDTLHRHLKGDENSAEDAKTMLDACGSLQRAYGCATLLVHHTGVSDEAQHRARGSSAWRGALDTEVSVVPGIDGPLEVVHRKSKDAEMSKSVFMTITSVPLPWVDDDGETVTSAVVVEADTPMALGQGESQALGKARQFFESAAIKYGYIMADGRPFISAGDLTQYAATHGDYATDGARRAAVGKAKRMLEEGGYVAQFQGGYAIENQQMAMAILLCKSESK